jgi:hypothetical protein
MCLRSTPSHTETYPNLATTLHIRLIHHASHDSGSEAPMTCPHETLMHLHRSKKCFDVQFASCGALGSPKSQFSRES